MRFCQPPVLQSGTDCFSVFGKESESSDPVLLPGRAPGPNGVPRPAWSDHARIYRWNERFWCCTPAGAAKPEAPAGRSSAGSPVPFPSVQAPIPAARRWPCRPGLPTWHRAGARCPPLCVERLSRPAVHNPMPFVSPEEGRLLSGAATCPAQAPAAAVPPAPP